MRSTTEHSRLTNELIIARVITGLWQIADMEREGRLTDPEAATDAMQAYVDAGLTTFDMADHYGSSELLAGHFRTHSNDGPNTQMFTKWVPQPGPITERLVRDAVERALTRLQTDRLDLMQFHTWEYANPVWLDALFWLQKMREEGLIGALGATNFDTAHLRIALQSGIDIVSNQVCFSLLDQRPLRAMTDLCLEHEVKLLCYGTLAGGFLTERWLGKPEPLPSEAANYSQMKYHRFIDAAGGWEVFQNILRALQEVSTRHGVSMANVASRYVLEQPAVGGVIIGSRLGESEHIEDTLKLFSFALDDESRRILAAALDAKTPLPGDSGDEYRKPPFLTASGDLSDHLETHPSPWPAVKGADERTRVSTGTPWETIGGFSRAVQAGGRILISGTTATHDGRVVGGCDVVAQAHFVIDKIEGALRSLGSGLEDVVRTRVYVRHLEDWEAVARVHGERFAAALPANTLVQANLVGDEYLVEIEAEAVTQPTSSADISQSPPKSFPSAVDQAHHAGHRQTD